MPQGADAAIKEAQMPKGKEKDEGQGKDNGGSEGSDKSGSTSLSDSEHKALIEERDLAKRRFEGLDQAIKKGRRYLYEEQEVEEIRTGHKQALKDQQEKHDMEVKKMVQHNNLRMLVAAQDLDPDFAKLITNAEYDDENAVKNTDDVVKALKTKLGVETGTEATKTEKTESTEKTEGTKTEKTEGTKTEKTESEIEFVGNIFKRLAPQQEEVSAT